MKYKNRKCLCCSKLIYSDNEKQIYCSSHCRTLFWQQHHRDKCAIYARRNRLKQIIKCRFCNTPIPTDKRGYGVVFCSSECRRNKRLNKSRSVYKNASNAFSVYKKKKGCLFCKYNRFGGSLDFHHKDPNEKDFRISSRQWMSKSDAIKKELKKCILVCKNHHYELHYIMKNDMKTYLECIKNPKKLLKNKSQKNGDI